MVRKLFSNCVSTSSAKPQTSLSSLHSIRKTNYHTVYTTYVCIGIHKFTAAAVEIYRINSHFHPFHDCIFFTPFIKSTSLKIIFLQNKSAEDISLIASWNMKRTATITNGINCWWYVYSCSSDIEKSLFKIEKYTVC